MTNKTSNHQEHDEIMSLLPWFVNQTLDGNQREVVLSHIDTCKDCQSEIRFLTSLNETIKDDAQNNHSMHADVDKNLSSVMNRIDLESQKIETAVSISSVLRQKLSKIFEFATAMPLPQRSAAALAGLLVALVGFQLLPDPSDNNYSVLSSSNINDTSMRLSVELTPTATIQHALSTIQLEIEKLEQQIDIETSTDGMFTIIFRDTIGVSELSQLVVDLERDVQIMRVEILH